MEVLKQRGYIFNKNVILKDLPEVIVASMRVMERLECICAIPEYCFNIYNDGEYKEKDIDVEVCEAVTEIQCPVRSIK